MTNNTTSVWPNFSGEPVQPLMPKELFLGCEIGPVDFADAPKYFGEILNRHGGEDIGIRLLFTPSLDSQVKIEINSLDTLRGIPFDSYELETLQEMLELCQEDAATSTEGEIISVILSSDGDLTLLSEDLVKGPLGN